MKYEILINSVFRLPLDKARDLLSEYKDNVGFQSFAEQQRVLDIVTQKVNYQKMIREDVFKDLAFQLLFMAHDKTGKLKGIPESIKEYPMIVWIECIGALGNNEIVSLLNSYHKEFTPDILQTFIVNLSSDLQVEMIKKYSSELDCNHELFNNFYYSVSDEARIKLKELYPDVIDDDILLELSDMSQKELIKAMENNLERLNKINPDELVEFFLLNADNIYTFNKFFDMFKKKIIECSNERFELLISRYLSINEYGIGYATDDSDVDRLGYDVLFDMFKEKIHNIGAARTVTLFNCPNLTFVEEVILELIDVAYKDDAYPKFLRKNNINNIMKKYVERCNNKEYSIEDLEKLVLKIGSTREKLIRDDYIEPIIALGQLMKKNLITDKEPLFLELRNKFTSDLLGRCEKDGTCTDNISLNSIFYRLAKGNLDFSDIYNIKTYKGLIYISKGGKYTDHADYVTKFLSDEQLAKMNISLMFKWKNQDISITNPLLLERMGLQLLCYFGEKKGKYLLESSMASTRMEHLFDGLNYKDISINEDGTSNVNEELIRFLFGRGRNNETNSNINRMIRGEIPEFEKVFTDFCNSFEKTRKACNGVLSVKRVINYFEGLDFPIELKPDEIPFRKALKEMNSYNEETLREAIELCKDARSRKSSYIPKIKGSIGDFDYEILNLKDPLAVAVGYLSHCCFTIGGDSYSALKHSMRSKYGRTFVVYHKGNFIAQSWVWRNGDVVCFDSVEAGSSFHGAYDDDIGLLYVYKKAAREIMEISKEEEDKQDAIKVVTVGRSDYKFQGLKDVDGESPAPLEHDIYAYDSRNQRILSGEMPSFRRCGAGGTNYQDPRRKVIYIDSLEKANVDLLDEAIINVQSIRYRINGAEEPMSINKYSEIITGEDWYITLDKNGNCEYGIIDGDDRTRPECNKYLETFGVSLEELSYPANNKAQGVVLAKK